MAVICTNANLPKEEDGAPKIPAMYIFRHKLVHQIFLHPEVKALGVALSVKRIIEFSVRQGVPEYEFLNDPENAEFMESDALTDILEELTKHGWLKKSKVLESYKAGDNAHLYDAAEDFRLATAAALADVVNKEHFAEMLPVLTTFVGREQQFGDTAINQLHELYIICAAFLQALRSVEEVAIRLKKIDNGKGKGLEIFRMKDDPPPGTSISRRRCQGLLTTMTKRAPKNGWPPAPLSATPSLKCEPRWGRPARRRRTRLPKTRRPPTPKSTASSPTTPPRCGTTTKAFGNFSRRALSTPRSTMKAKAGGWRRKKLRCPSWMTGLKK